MPATRASQSFSGLYVILDPSVRPARSLSEVLKSCATGGARIFQYRNKNVSMKEAYPEALALRQIAADLGALFIVNDRCDLALAVDADGVHLGQDDFPYLEARKALGSEKIIGLSTHNAAQVKEANALTPDYIGFGPIFTPASKHDHDPIVGLDGLRLIRTLTTLPVFAIGGIQLDQARSVVETGANGIAVISAVLNAPDITKAVRDLIGELS